MTEFNRVNGINNINNINGVQNVQYGKGEQNRAEFESVPNDKTINNLSGHADVVGRSQIQKSDNLQADIEFVMRNPELMAKTEQFFEMAYAKLLREDAPNAYEKASALATTFAREIASR